MYIPHVLPMQVDQPLQIYTDDPFSHNIHPVPKLNPEWNKSQLPGSPPIQTKWSEAEFIQVKCNIHPWMHGYFAVHGWMLHFTWMNSASLHLVWIGGLIQVKCNIHP